MTCLFSFILRGNPPAGQVFSILDAFFERKQADFLHLHVLLFAAALCVRDGRSMHLLLVDPVVLSGLPALDLTLLEPQSNLLLGRLDSVRAVADIAADVLCTWCISTMKVYGHHENLQWHSRHG